MSDHIFEIREDADQTATMAKGFMAEANQQAEAMATAVYDGVQRFWYRNVDTEGNPSPERHAAIEAKDATENTPAVEAWAGSQEPTGLEILAAMGGNAQKFLAVSFARVQMLLTLQAQLGLSLIDPAKVAGPYELTFNEDGTVKTATHRA